MVSEPSLREVLQLLFLLAPFSCSVAFACLLLLFFATPFWTIEALRSLLGVNALRTRALRRLAHEHAISSFEPRGDPAILQELSGFWLFSLRRSTGEAWNVLSDTVSSVEGRIFDYRYRLPKFKSGPRVRRQTVVHFRSTALALPRFSMLPIASLTRQERWDQHSLSFPSHPSFSDRYVVFADEMSQVRKLFDAELLSFFEKVAPISVEGAGQDLICYRRYQLMAPQSLLAIWNEGSVLRKLFEARAPTNKPSTATHDSTN